MEGQSEGAVGAGYFSHVSNEHLPADIRGKESFSPQETREALARAAVLLKHQTESILNNHAMGDILRQWDETPLAEYYTVLLTNAQRSEMKNFSDEEKQTVSDYFIYESGKRRAANGPSPHHDRFTTTFLNDTGQPITMEEGIPLDGLFIALEKQIRSLESDILQLHRGVGLSQSDRNAQIAEKKKQIEQFHRDGRILYKNSAQVPSAWRVSSPETAQETSLAWQRAKLEANNISVDPLRNQGDPQKNFLSGVQTMRRRYELRISEEPVSPLTPAPVAREPVAAPIAPLSNDPPSRPQTIEEMKEVIVMVSREEDIQHRAKEMAQESLRQEFASGEKSWNPWKKIKQWARKVKFRTLEQYYEEKRRVRVEDAMREHKNSYLQMDIAKNEAATYDPANRFQTEDVIRNMHVEASHGKDEEKESAEAKISQVKAGVTLEGEKITDADEQLKKLIVQDIFIPIIKGESSSLLGGRVFSDEKDIHTALGAFVEANQNNPIVKEYFGGDPAKRLQVAKYFATNFWDASQRLKARYLRHEFSEQETHEKIDLKFGKLIWAAQTQMQRSSVDRMIQAAEKVPILKGNLGLINPATLGAAASIVTLPVRALASREIGLFLPAGTGIAVGGTFAALRRFSEMKKDEKMHQVQRAYNDQIPDSAKRRKDMELFSYDIAQSDHLINGGGTDLLTNTQRESLDTLMNQDLHVKANQDALIHRIAEIQSRLDMSIKTKSDFIRFEGRRHVEQNRWDLMKQIIAARKKLTDTTPLNSLDIHRLELLEVSKWNDALDTNKKTQDKAFFKKRLIGAVQAGVIGGVVGAASGLVSQEIVAGAFRLGESLVHESGQAVSAIDSHITSESGHAIARGLQSLYQKEENLAHMFTGPTLLEKGIHHASQYLRGDHAANILPSGTLSGSGNVDFQRLYQGGSETINGQLQIHVGPGFGEPLHPVHIFDTQGHDLLPGVSATMDASGHIHVEGQISMDVQNMLDQSGFQTNRGSDISFDLLKAGAPMQVSEAHTFSGIPVQIPEGTQWVPTGQNGHFDLMAIGDGTHPAQVMIKDAYISNGHLEYSSLHHLHKADIQETTNTIRGDFSERQKFWEIKGEKVHKEWYGYNAPGSQGNELRQFNSVTGKNGDGVRVYTNNPDISIQEGLDPSHLNVPQAIKDGKMVYMVSIPGTDQHIIIPDGADGVIDGAVNFDPSDNTHFITMADGTQMSLGQFTRERLVDSSIFQGKIPTGKGLSTEWRARTDKNFLNVFKIGGADGKSGHIEGAIKWENPDGSVVYKVINTIRGHGAPGDVTTSTIKISSVDVPTDPIPTYEISPSNPPGDAPIIPFPAAPRFPLERLPEDPKPDPTKKSDTTDFNNGSSPRGYGYRGYGYRGYGYPSSEKRGYRGYIREAKKDGHQHSVDIVPGNELVNQVLDFIPPSSLSRRIDSPLHLLPRGENEEFFYRSRSSDRLQKDPDVNLDYLTEVTEYLQFQDPEYKKILRRYSDQKGMKEPIDDRCDLSVCIPVYALGEGKKVKHALDQYYLQIDESNNQQAVDPHKFEIVIFLNHPKPKREELEKKLGHSYLEGARERVAAGAPEDYDTEEVIRQFQEQHPELRIRVMKTEFDHRPVWGSIVKPLYDTALLRSLGRNSAGQRDFAIVTNDIDVVRMSPSYIHDSLQQLELNELASKANPNVQKIDGYVGKLDLGQEVYDALPEMLLSQRFYQMHDLARGVNHGAYGGNTIMRASTYAAVGGINPNYDEGADGELGAMVGYARGFKNSLPFNNRLWLETDPRRQVKSFTEGTLLADNWDNWAAMDVYDKNWREQISALDRQNPENVNKELLENEINRLLGKFLGGYYYDPTRRALAFLGLRTQEAYQSAVNAAEEQSRKGNTDVLTKTLEMLGLENKDYRIENGHIIVLRNDYTVHHKEDHDYISIEDITSVRKYLKQYVDEGRSLSSETKVTKALSHLPHRSIRDYSNNPEEPTRYMVNYRNYEQFNELNASIFLKEDYLWRPSDTSEKSRIIDLGGNIGLSALHWKTIAPNSNVTVVEADPRNASLLHENIKQNNLQDVVVISGAISEDSGETTLYSSKKGEDFRLGNHIGIPPSDISRYDKVPVRTVRLSELIGNEPVDLVKVDVPGEELNIIHEAQEKLNYAKAIEIQFLQSPDNPVNSLRETLTILLKNGFHVEVREEGEIVDPMTIAPQELRLLHIFATHEQTQSSNSNLRKQHDNPLVSDDSGDLSNSSSDNLFFPELKMYFPDSNVERSILIKDPIMSATKEMALYFSNQYKKNKEQRKQDPIRFMTNDPPRVHVWELESAVPPPELEKVYLEDEKQRQYYSLRNIRLKKIAQIDTNTSTVLPVSESFLLDSRQVEAMIHQHPSEFENLITIHPMEKPRQETEKQIKERIRGFFRGTRILHRNADATSEEREILPLPREEIGSTRKYEQEIDPDDGIKLACSVSIDGRRSQDSVGYVKTEGNKVIGIVADGVGGTCLSDLASHEAVLGILSSPSSDLTKNVMTASQSVQEITEQVLMEEISNSNLPSLQEQALQGLAKNEGSETTLLQVEINTDTGKIEDGLFHGDGYIAIIRQDGSIETHFVGSASSRISSRRGVVHGESSLKLADVFPSGISLEKGETILIGSDGLRRVIENHHLIDELCEKLKGNPDTNIAQLFFRSDVYPKGGDTDDDKGVFVYTRP